MEKGSGNEKEIDLLELFARVCSGIGKGLTLFILGIYKGLVHLLHFFIKHFFWLSGGLASGFILVYFCGSLIGYTFISGEAKLSCYGTNPDDIELEIYKINTIVQSKKTSFLADPSILNIDPLLAAKLQSLQIGYGVDKDNDGSPDLIAYQKALAQNIYEEKNLKGNNSPDVVYRKPLQKRISNPFFLRISVKTEDLASFYQLCQAVLDYLNRNPVLLRQQKINIEGMKFHLAEIDKQLVLLDSLQKINYFENSRKDQRNQGNSFYVSSVPNNDKQNDLYHEDVLELSKDREALFAQLQSCSNIVTIQSNFLPTPMSLTLEKSALILLWFGFFALLALLFEYRRSILNYIANIRKSHAHKMKL